MEKQTGCRTSSKKRKKNFLKKKKGEGKGRLLFWCGGVVCLGLDPFTFGLDLIIKRCRRRFSFVRFDSVLTCLKGIVGQWKAQWGSGPKFMTIRTHFDFSSGINYSWKVFSYLICGQLNLLDFFSFYYTSLYLKQRTDNTNSLRKYSRQQPSKATSQHRG